MFNIVIIDGNTLNPGDLSWEKLTAFGSVQVYGESSKQEGLSRLMDADIVLTNKFVMDSEIIHALPRLKCICVTATGYNMVDLVTATEKGIVVCNASGYSTPSTAQHTIALLLELTNHCGDYNQSVANGDWTASKSWTYTRKPVIELSDMTLGIVGLGTIGRKVAAIAQSLGMHVIANKRSQSSGLSGDIEMVDLETIFTQSDVVSLHAPLNEDTKELINSKTLSLMKPTALLINTGRGGLINEDDLYYALKEGKIAGAGLDVLGQEPPKTTNPLIGLDNCIITPHVAWGSRASRKRLLEISIDNVQSFISGVPQNKVN